MQKKRPHSDILGQVDHIHDELGSIRSEKQLDRVSIKELDTEHAIARMNYARQEMEYRFLHKKHDHKRQDAAIVHQHAREMREDDVQVEEAKTKAFAAQAEVLCLQIELQKLSHSGGPSDVV